MSSEKTNRFGVASKTAAIILFTVTVLLIFACSLGILICYYSGFYSDIPIDANNNALSSYFESIASENLSNYSYYLVMNRESGGYNNILSEYERRFSSKYSNLRFTITDLEGKVIAQNLDGYENGLPKNAYETNYTYYIENRGPVQALYFESHADCIKYIQYLKNSGTEYLINGPYPIDADNIDSYSPKGYDMQSYTGDESSINMDDESEQEYESETENEEMIPSDTPTKSSAYYINIQQILGKSVTVKCTSYISETLSAHDVYYNVFRILKFLDSIKYILFIVLVFLLIIAVSLTVFLCCVAGRRKGEVGVRANFIDKIPFDLLLGIYIALLAIAIYIYATVDRSIYLAGSQSVTSILAIAISLLIICISPIFVSFIMTFATRLKLGGWYRNTVIYKILHFIYRKLKKFFAFIKKCIYNAHSITKAIIFLLIFIFTDITILSSFESIGLGIWIIRTGILIFITLMFALDMNLLKQGTKKMCNGELDFKINTNDLHFDSKEIGKDFNNIGEGLSNAVSKQTQSERMKTELITNVSHDIKTPLTCIINYIDLLEKENINSEPAKDYIKTLHSQAYRLKKLTEDLVEASKASTGNITVNKEILDLNLLLSQAIGEYEDKFHEKNIDILLLLCCEKENAYISCDGQLLWRVLDNLLSNIDKYAQEHTRVYVSTERKGGHIILTFKNVSKYALNISAEELTERFVRGDSSRNTEGSGLGLSIAKNLTELQGGSFNIKIDGDLFKTIISFNEINSETKDDKSFN